MAIANTRSRLLSFRLKRNLGMFEARYGPGSKRRASVDANKHCMVSELEIGSFFVHSAAQKAQGARVSVFLVWPLWFTYISF